MVGETGALTYFAANLFAMYSIEDLLIDSGCDPAMTGSAPEALRRKLTRDWQIHTAEALLALPIDRITAWKPWPDSGPLHSDAAGRVVVSLPDDFLRLLSLQLDCWECPVTEILPPGDWRRRLQDCRFQSLGASARRPLAFLTSDASGRRCLELFGAPPDTTVKIAAAWYLQMPSL